MYFYILYFELCAVVCSIARISDCLFARSLVVRSLVCLCTSSGACHESDDDDASKGWRRINRAIQPFNRVVRAEWLQSLSSRKTDYRCIKMMIKTRSKSMYTSFCESSRSLDHRSTLSRYSCPIS